MSRHHEQLLRRICQNEATLTKAKAILHTVSLKTTPGSGYELGQGTSGLPAICAYIAAEELGDDEVDEKTAQVASCLKPKVFKTTLHTVRSAFAAAAAAGSPTKKTSRTVSYKELVDDAKIGRKGMVTGWMHDAERTLMNNREMRRRFGSAYDAITVAVFCWVCKLMGSKKVNPPALLDKRGIPRDQFDELTDALHEQCKDIVKVIQEDIAAIKTGTYAPKQPPVPAGVPSSPTKGSVTTLPLPPPIRPPSRSLSRSPSKSALRAPSVGLTPTKTPNHKRKVAFHGPIEEEEEEFDLTATPSKRQKLSSPVKPFPSDSIASTPRAPTRISGVAAAREAEPVPGPSTPRRQRTTPSQPSSTHSSSRLVRSRSQTGSAPTTPSRKSRLPTVREEAEGPPRRRCRPVFADQQQWLKGDSRLERELKPWQDKWQQLVQRAGGDVWKAAGLAGEGAATVHVGA